MEDKKTSWKAKKDARPNTFHFGFADVRKRIKLDNEHEDESYSLPVRAIPLAVLSS